MDNVELDDFTCARYAKFAKDFVDIYEERGSQAAGLHATKNLRQEEMVIVEPFVTKEFIDRGYHFNGVVAD